MPTFRVPLFLCTILLWQSGDTPSFAPKLVVQVFYATLQKTMSMPLPKALRTLSRFLSNDFNQLIADAVKADDEYLKKNPTDKGFFGDGTCFLYGGGDCDFSSYKILGMKSKGNTVEARVELSLKDVQRPKKPPATWIDTLTLVQEKDTWVIRDIGYFGEKASSILQDDIREARKDVQN